ncbi:MAG TPA: nicotinate phosphoribosyltransferase [Thermoanaerobaculia bacterium]|nr:nicotinate phosphoribosyltransferase [Thermoanaerobaculia bacterium]
MPTSFSLGEADLALATDLYQLTMAAAYHAWAADSGEMPRATFELWVRRLAAERRFLVFAGLEQALAALRDLSFTYEQIDYLRSLAPFHAVDPAFFDHLAELRFQGDVRAMPEGSVFFAGEPVVSLTGTLLEAQLVETLLLNVVNFQTTIASKAARVRLAAGDAVKVAEFGTRRAHGPQAGAWAARAAWVGGVDSTSNVLAGQRAGVPVVGTMAHSFVMAHDDEAAAFRRYQETFPGHTILLVDTYDTLDGVRTALATGGPFDGVRLDSGDLGELARETRRLLDDGGRPDATIFASGDVDEHRIAELRASGAPIDAYGMGTRLATSADAPYLSGVYKLVEVEHAGTTRGAFKLSSGKVTYPGPKQVIRETAADGTFGEDLLLRRRDEADHPEASRLLVPVMEKGVPLDDSPAAPFDAASARRRCAAQLTLLPDAVRSLDPVDDGEEARRAVYPVRVDRGLEAYLEEERAELDDDGGRAEKSEDDA